MPPKKVKSKDEHDSDSSDGLNEIANLNIDDDNKLSEIVVGVEEDIFDIEDVKENNSLFRGPYKGIGIKIDPIISGKRSRSHPSPIIASPFSPLSSGNNTPISIGSIGSYNTESSNKAIAFEKSKKHKKEGMRITSGSYIYADEINQKKHKNGLVENFYNCYNNIGRKYFNKRKNEKKEVQKQCSICLEELEGKPTCTTLCNHTFCSSCFHRHAGRSWGRGNDGYNCPLCRAINS